jgi:hypothetical protein
MKREHDENVAGDKEREAAKLEKAKQHKTEMSTIWKQRQREREKQAEIKLGKRDADGKLWKIKVHLTSISHITDYLPDLLEYEPHSAYIFLSECCRSIKIEL